MILIVSSERDPHALIVADTLRRRGLQVAIGDTSEFSRGAQLVQRKRDVLWIRADGTIIALNTVRTVWSRRMWPIDYDVELSDMADRLFVQRQWNEALWGLILSLPAAIISDPFLQQAASKPRQLVLARRFGLQTPETLITNDRSRVEQFRDEQRGEIIHKTLAASNEQFLYTKKWDADDEACLDELVLAPVIFQSVVTGSREVRVTIVGEKCFAAEFVPNGHVDGRLDNNAEYQIHELPGIVQRRLVRLMREFGLAYSTVDLRIDERGEYVFLDLNPQGQYLFVEIRTGQPITAAVADLLESKHSEARPDADHR